MPYNKSALHATVVGLSPLYWFDWETCVCGLSLYLCAGVCYFCVFGTSRGNFGSMCPKNSGEKLLGRYVIYTTSTKTILLLYYGFDECT